MLLSNQLYHASRPVFSFITLYFGLKKDLSNFFRFCLLVSTQVMISLILKSKKLYPFPYHVSEHNGHPVHHVQTGLLYLNLITIHYPSSAGNTCYLSS